MALPVFPYGNMFDSSQNLIVGLIYISPSIHILAYVVYLIYSLGDQIKPNPWSWFMFAYGTALITFLEWKLGAPWVILFLPSLCSVMSIGIFVISLTSARSDSLHPADILAFAIDIAITCAYWWAAQQASVGEISEVERNWYVNAFLLGTILTTFTSFSPLIREGRANLGTERPLPWLLWGFAYVSLLALTVLQVGSILSPLLLYPLVNVVIHFWIARLSIQSRTG